MTDVDRRVHASPALRDVRRSLAPAGLREPVVPVSRGRFRRYVRRALDALPVRYREAAENVEVVVERSPGPADRGHSPRSSRSPVFGVYRGVPLPQRAEGYELVAPDVIALFRRPLWRVSRGRRRLQREIERTVAHEFGHYFGLEESALEHV
jgi:predicted Zn-dependent protease with MMP-like domain